MKVFTIDIGNSHPHCGEFYNGELSNVSTLKPGFDSGDEPVVVSAVGNETFHHEAALRPNHYYENGKYFDMPVHYTQQLGEDRLVQAGFLYHQWPDELSSFHTVVLIDAGTFITVDIVNKSEGFLGGYIYPGISHFFSSFPKGNLLPKNDFVPQLSSRPGSNTLECIQFAGGQYLQSIISRAARQHKEAGFLLTGGSAEHLSTDSISSQFVLKKHYIHYSLFDLFCRVTSS